MDLKDYMDSNGQSVVPILAPVQGSGGFLEFSGSSMSIQDIGLSEAAAAYHFDVSYENLSYLARMRQLNTNLACGNMSSTFSNNRTNSGLSIGASSVTDAYSTMSDDANLQRTSSISMESYRNLPSSPLSFSSNNMGAVEIDGASIGQPTLSHSNQSSQLARKRLRPRHHPSSLSVGKEQEINSLPQISKKPRLDLHSENVFCQHIIQQQLQKQDPLVFQDYNQQVKTLLQQHKLQKQQHRQVFQLVPQFLAVSAQQQQQIRHYMQLQAKHPVSPIQPLDSGICSRRLLQFIYHLQHRSSDNSITYWRKFVAEYYAPGAKKKWCLSLYNGLGERALGVFSQSAMEAWHCDMCAFKSGKGFDAKFELLPRLYKLFFESGVIDELLFLDLPQEYILPSGAMVLRYQKAVQETVYQQFRVVREGQLRIIFRNDLKILSWEFCARYHDEVVPRRLVAPQVNELVQAAKKYQRDGGSHGVSVQNLHSTCNMFVTAESQLMRNLDLLLVNELGFPKRYIRCLQIAEIVDSMKDLMTFSLDNNIGPIESLRKYSREETIANTEVKQMSGIPATAEAVMTGPKQAAFGGISCYQKMQRQNSTSNSEQHNPSGLVNYSNPNANCPPHLGPKTSCQSLIQGSPISGTSGSTLSETDENLQQQMIDKILQQMVSNTQANGKSCTSVKVKEEVIEKSNGSPTADVATRNRGMCIAGNGLDLSNMSAAAGKSVYENGPNMRGSLKSASSSNSSQVYGTNTCVDQEPNVENFYLPEAIREMDSAFFGNGVLNDDWKGIGWKG